MIIDPTIINVTLQAQCRPSAQTLLNSAKRESHHMTRSAALNSQKAKVELFLRRGRISSLVTTQIDVPYCPEIRSVQLHANETTIHIHRRSHDHNYLSTVHWYSDNEDNSRS